MEISVSDSPEMTGSTSCGQLSTVTSSTPMPVLTTCASGAVGRFLQMIRNANGVIMDIAELDVIVMDAGESQRNQVLKFGSIPSRQRAMKT